MVEFREQERQTGTGGIFRSASGRYVGLMNPNHWPVLDWGAITQMYDGIAYIDTSQNPAGLWLAESLEYTDSIDNVYRIVENSS